MQSPGVSVLKVEDKLGLRASSTAQVVLENVRVPVENILGEEHKGFKAFMQTLERGRVAIAAMSLGLAEAAFERAVRFAKTPDLRARHRAAPTIQAYLADMAAQMSGAPACLKRGLQEGRGRSIARGTINFGVRDAVWVCERAIRSGGYGCASSRSSASGATPS
jgi:alkylation response protein AidB-like acyl-CoA dehydrogenase